jgi:hypothetical protein
LDKSAFDLDFESPSPRGFYTGGNGYQVQLDSEVFHSGKQSLRIRHVATEPDDRKAVDPKLAVSTWREVVQHVGASRQSYIEKKAAACETDWAVQNARVILQCMQMRADEVSRDLSMADNVKWILDHSPGAKMVLWAHNGHVSAGSIGAYEPMGASLRKMFGDQMVVFGFVFNQGSNVFPMAQSFIIYQPKSVGYVSSSEPVVRFGLAGLLSPRRSKWAGGEAGAIRS